MSLRLDVLHIDLELEFGLPLVDGLALELTVLDVQNAVSVALQIGVVRHLGATNMSTTAMYYHDDQGGVPWSLP